jgi:hypothetical protein
MNIEIDFDVYKALTVRRSSETVTYNDVLRELLKLSPIAPGRLSAPAPTTSEVSARDWIPKGVRFPEGTEFRARFKRQMYSGKVEAGALVVDGKRFHSPSAAAGYVTKNFVNGWNFWECRYSGETNWKNIMAIRNGRT